ncbi:dihydroorotase [Bhargavaea ginsengi]|uniref:dihydroorotase n=1 Tax=Bhargavaea ginsengi TaxID=426757 RepID=UPI003C72222B
MKADLLISNGQVVFPKTGVRKANIAVKDEKIVAILEEGETVEASTVIDAKGKFILPGVIDAHQHLGIYNPLEQDFLDTKQHAVGGVTTIVNYDRQPVSYLEYFPKVKKIGEENSYVDFSYSFGILKEQHLDELEELVETHGLTSFKFFRNYERQLNDKFNIEDGIDLSAHDLLRILEKFKSVSPKLLLAVHCENMDINRSLIKSYKEKGEDEGLVTWSKTSPGYAEAESLLSTLYMNKIAGGNVYIVHLTSGASVEVLKNTDWLQGDGVVVETCPHYLVLTEESEVDLKAKVGPPIHSKEDQELLWEGIEQGLITTIGTDHVPASLEKKQNSGHTFDVLYGFPGAGSLLPLMLTEGHKKRGLPLERIAEITSFNVAESFNLPSKGRIEPGADADLVIVDLEAKEEITPERMHAESDFTVYEGIEAYGWPVYTISRGEVIVEKGKPVKESGRGKYIRRSI